MDKYSYIANAHGNYIDELYQSFKEDPSTVDESWQRFFEGFEFSREKYGEPSRENSGEATGASKETKVRDLIHAYRSRGHLEANTNPVRKRRDHKAKLSIEDHSLTNDDLDIEFEVGAIIGIGKASLRKILASLRAIYSGSIGFEFMYIRSPEILSWFRDKLEREALTFEFSKKEKERILWKLNEAVVFENFLHTKYIGQKRFSLEGGETTIPALDSIINAGAELGIEEVVIGMAHRGRLNVLANIMGKTYEQIFNEFEGSMPEETMGDGDVKYHMGYSSLITTETGKQVNLKLAPNPSHLEAVNPVVEGFVRAKVDAQYEHDYDKILPVIIHGDAALAGQGIVYEVAQMAALKGYTTGGTIHFVINNQIGFTTDFDDARTSIYSTDVAKVIDAPVLHVNGDHPESVVYCMRLAAEFRQKFNQDIFVDMVCYRRHGHNESDEPKFTQPSLYNIISKHANPREIYNKTLIERGDVDSDLAKTMDKKFRQLLQDRLNLVKQKPLPYVFLPLEKQWQSLRRSNPADFDRSPETGVPQKTIDLIGKALIKTPKGFSPIKQIEKQLKTREDMFFKSKMLNWAAAELLSYGSLLLEGNPVRMSGQDVQRGTFSHRHAVLHDANTNQAYNSLDNIDQQQARFMIYNSLLSEFGVLGFEFGYSMANPNALVIWEAQFGDFANGAQVMFDQFIATIETKWQRMSGVVMLLPHGYEGQGPEHSNARPERYLQLAADFNIIVANITEPSNYFHMIRRQLAWPFRKPLIVMSPKSLLRHPKVVSPLKEFTKGAFRELLPDTYATKSKVKQVLICSGKIYYDLAEFRETNKRKDVAILRIEQLFPFPDLQLDDELERFPKAKYIWVQEEPSNMGYWSFVLRTYHRTLHLIARKPGSSPATGYHKQHDYEQNEIIETAFEI
jgi:2-oxoglutarate dehydrogenase E1 component